MAEYDPDLSPLRDAIPPGWYAGPVSVSVDWTTGRRTYESSFHGSSGKTIEGGPLRLYVGAPPSVQPTHRRLEVEASAGSIEQLADFAPLLPGLDAMAGVPWPVEFRIHGDTFPD